MEKKTIVMDVVVFITGKDIEKISQSLAEQWQVSLLHVPDELERMKQSHSVFGPFIKDNMENEDEIELLKQDIIRFCPQRPIIITGVKMNRDILRAVNNSKIAIFDWDVESRIPPFNEISFKDPPPPSKAFEGYKFQKAFPYDRVYAILKCLHLCSVAECTVRFPGTHPISLNRKHVKMFKEQSYVVSLKIDGIRYLLLVGYGRFWLFDRKMMVLKSSFKAPNDLLDGLLLDCEWLQRSNQPPNLFVIDVIAVRGQCVRGQDLFQRFQIFMPFLETLAFQMGMEVYVQQYQPMNWVSYYLDMCVSKRYDGLVFTPVIATYRLGRNTKLLKWKSQEQNTADFLVKGNSIYSQGENQLVREGYIDQGKDNSIVECAFDRGKWKFRKQRNDKENPNPDWVVANIIQSIQENDWIVKFLSAPWEQNQMGVLFRDK